MAGIKEWYQQEKQNEKILQNQEALKDNPDAIPTLLETAKAYYDAENYEKAIEYSQKILKINAKDVGALHILSYTYYYANDDKRAIDYCNQWLVIDIKNPIPIAVLNKIYERKAKQGHKLALQETKRALKFEKEARQEAVRALKETERASREEQARLIEQAKVEERNKIIADLSHSIKNLISTVIDPLENLKQHIMPEQRQAIENALRGTNLVREIVNAMNLSSKGAIEDFYHDARHNAGKDIFNLQSMCIKSLQYSVGNMFDGKYFSNFMRKYFPTRELYIQAKSEWDKVSQADNIPLLRSFLQQYFFKIDVVLDNAERFIIGNEKGSAIKLLILFQEIVLNAVKYSAFVSKKERFLKICFLSNREQVSIKVENSFKSNVKTKTSGLGHVIIENFAKIINAEHVVRKDDNVYIVEIVFGNLWERESQ